MKDYETRITIGKTSSLYIGGKPVELLQLGSPSQPVLSACEVVVEPEREMNIPAMVRDPEQVTIQTLYEPKTTLFRECGLMAPSALVEGDSSPFYIRVYNPTQQQVKIRANTRMGTLREVGNVALAYKHARVDEESHESTIHDDDASAVTLGEKKIQESGTTAGSGESQRLPETAASQTSDLLGSRRGDSQQPELEKTKEAEKEEVPAHLAELYKRSVQEVAEDDREEVKKIMREFSDIFATSPADIGRTDLIVHDIYTGKAAPVHQRARRQSPEEHAAMKKQVMLLLC